MRTDNEQLEYIKNRYRDEKIKRHNIKKNVLTITSSALMLIIVFSGIFIFPSIVGSNKKGANSYVDIPQQNSSGSVTAAVGEDNNNCYSDSASGNNTPSYSTAAPGNANSEKNENPTPSDSAPKVYTASSSLYSADLCYNVEKSDITDSAALYKFNYNGELIAVYICQTEVPIYRMEAYLKSRFAFTDMYGVNPTENTQVFFKEAFIIKRENKTFLFAKLDLYNYVMIEAKMEDSDILSFAQSLKIAEK